LDRCALFVDASYVLADGALAVHGTRNRDSVSWDYTGLLKLLGGLSRDRTGLPLLRCYWYDTAAGGNRAAEHDSLADVPGVKLRLSKVRPNRREGVESEIRKDLTALARNRAVSDVIIVSGEEDLAPVIAEVQDLGVRTVLLHISADDDWAVSRTLRQECDDIIDVAAGHLRPYVDLIPGAEPELGARGYRELATGPQQVSGAGQISGPHHSIDAPAARLYGSPVAAEYDREPQLLGMDGRGPREQVPGQDAARFTGQSGLGGAGEGMSSGQVHRVADPQALGQQYQPADAGRSQMPATAGQGQGGYFPTGFAPRDSANGQVANGQAGPASIGMGQRTGVGDGRGQSGQHHGLQAGSTPGAGMPAGLPGQASGGVHAAGGLGMPGAGGQAGSMQAAGQANGMPTGVAGNGMSANGMPANGQAGHSGQLNGPPGGSHAEGSVPPGGTQPGGMPHGAMQPGSMHQGAMHQGAMHQGGVHQGGVHQGGVQQAGMPQGGMAQQGNSMQGNAMPGGGLSQNGVQHSLPGQSGAAAPLGQGLPMPPGQFQGMPPHAPGTSAPGQHGIQRPGSGPGVPHGGLQQAGHIPAEQPRQQMPQRQLPAGNGAPYPQDRGGQYGGAPQASAYGGSPTPAQAAYPAGPYGAPQPMPAPPVAISVGEAVQSAHAEGFGFGEAVARDAPALWLEAVLARKPRMPSDLEARLLQGSALPIDSLLHDEVRHALRRGFWDALERSRH
jgi:NYN domain